MSHTTLLIAVWVLGAVVLVLCVCVAWYEVNRCRLVRLGEQAVQSGLIAVRAATVLKDERIEWDFPKPPKPVNTKWAVKSHTAVKILRGRFGAA